MLAAFGSSTSCFVPPNPIGGLSILRLHRTGLTTGFFASTKGLPSCGRRLLHGASDHRHHAARNTDPFGSTGSCAPTTTSLHGCRTFVLWTLPASNRQSGHPGATDNAQHRAQVSILAVSRPWNTCFRSGFKALHEITRQGGKPTSTGINLQHVRTNDWPQVRAR